MTTVHFLNNYSMTEALRLYRAGEYPGHHLWGYPLDGDQSDDLRWRLPSRSLFEIPAMKSGALKRVRSAILKLVGDPLQQFDVLRHVRRGDVIYAADQRTGFLLAMFRSLRLFHTPMVVVVHHAPSTFIERKALSRIDSAIVLSRYVREQLPDGLRRRAVFGPWGPHVASLIYSNAKAEGRPPRDFISAGKTNRDGRTLRLAVASHGLSGWIFDEDGRTEFVDGAVVSTDRSRSSYADILGAMAAARVVVIPLADPETMAGLTEVADAIALDKPVVVTASPALPYPARGRGLTSVAPQNADALGEAIRLATRSDGVAGLATTFSYRAFSDVVSEQVRSVIRS